MNDLTCVIPVRNENVEVVTKLYTDLTELGCKVWVVDDGNTMDLDIPHLFYPGHVGYGYAIKQGIKVAETELVMTLDGDGQHTVQDVINLYHIYKLRSDIKLVVGQRWLNYEKPIRWIGRKGLNFIASIITGHYLSDLNSGLRIFDRNIVKDYFPILCDTFSFTTSMSISMVADGHKIAYFPIDVMPRHSGKSHVKLVSDGLITLWYIIYCGIGCRTRGLRKWFAGR